jgi:hypothetical protein
MEKSESLVERWKWETLSAVRVLEPWDEQDNGAYGELMVASTARFI